MSTTAPSTSPVDRIKSVNHHLRVALDQVSDPVLILQNGPAKTGPVIAWGNAAAVRCMGLPASKLSGSPLREFLTVNSWRGLITDLKTAFQGTPSECGVAFTSDENSLRKGRAQPVTGPAGEIISVILTLPASAPAACSIASCRAVNGAKTTGPAPLDEPPPSPEVWHDDIIETIRETARQVAHEFNNALTSIVLPVQMAIRAVPHNSELFESLQVAHVSAQRATDLAKDFLDCFRPRAAVRGICCPGELLGRAIRLATCAQNIGATLDLGEELLDIDVDESQLERVIFNLIRNSCQAMPNGGRLRVSATNTTVGINDPIALPPGPYIQISVRDWGPGIPDEHRQHLFHSRFTTKPDGNGCGLPICYQIVRDHGGELMVRSRVNVGTEFIIYLPAAQVPSALPAIPEFVISPASENREAAASDRPEAEEKTFQLTTPSGRKVLGNQDPYTLVSEKPALSLLVVDDELGVRQALSQIAKIMGYEVTTAATSEEALQSYKDRLHAMRPYHSVLLDLNLRSGLNGYEVFKAIRRMDPEAVVVATSGQYANGDVERFQSLGFAGFLAKPYSLEHFDQVMRSALVS